MNEYSILAIERLLRNYPFISEDIDRLQKELEDWQNKKNTMYGIKAAAPTGMPPSGQISDLTFKTATEIIDKYQKEIDRLFNQITTLFDNQLTVKTLLARLTREERYVIEARYFQKQKPISWSKIAKAICFDKRSCYRIRSRALKKMASQF
jgi:RinA family phage transcriptional activator